MLTATAVVVLHSIWFTKICSLALTQLLDNERVERKMKVISIRNNTQSSRYKFAKCTKGKLDNYSSRFNDSYSVSIESGFMVLDLLDGCSHIGYDFERISVSPACFALIFGARNRKVKSILIKIFTRERNTKREQLFSGDMAVAHVSKNPLSHFNCVIAGQHSQHLRKIGILALFNL